MFAAACRRLVRPSGRRNLFSSISCFPAIEVNDAQRCTECHTYSFGELRRLGRNCKRNQIDGTTFNLLRDCGILRPFRGCRAGKALKSRNHIGSLNIPSIRSSNRICISNSSRLPPLSRYVIPVRHAPVPQRQNGREFGPSVALANMMSLGPNINELRCPGPSTSTVDKMKSRKVNVTIAHLNVRSMISREKFHLVKHTVINGKFDIFVISESWLDPSTTDNDISIPGYTTFRQDRGPHKSGGGIVIYIRKTFKASILSSLSTTTDTNSQQFWLKIQCRKLKTFLLCAVYRPDSVSIGRFLDDLSASLLDSLLLGMEVLVTGDVNADVSPGSSCPEGRALLDLCNSLHLSQLVAKPTRVTQTSKTLIDVVITTNTNFVINCDVFESAVADHCLVTTTLKLKAPKPSPSYIVTRSYKNYNPELFLSDLEQAPFHIANIFDDFDDQVNVFNSLFLDTLNDHAPIKRFKIKSRPNPFITPEIKQLMKTRDSWHKKARKSNDRLDWNAYRFFRQEVKCEIRISEMEHIRSELSNCNGNTNSIWKTIDRCLPNKDPPLTTTLNPLQQANKFNEFYTSVGEKAAAKAKLLSDQHGFTVDFEPIGTIESDHPLNNKFEFSTVTKEVVEKVILRIPSNKAAGCDKISAKVLKDSLPATLPIITSIINNSFAFNCFAQAWKFAEVVPNLKSGDSDEPENTRPISLLPVMSKVCERVAHTQFMNFLNMNGKIAGLQSGNRKWHSTETALLHYTDKLLKNMDEKQISIVVLLDMSKAFDSIRHDILLSKLRSIGLADSALAWFQSYLCSRKQVVRMGSTLSDPLTLSVGVPQGSILGPVLFTLYVNDLLSVPKKCKAMGYVDDTKLLLALPHNNIHEAVPDLNSDLRRVAKWCFSNSLLLNADKTKLLVVGVPQLTRAASIPPVVLLGKTIEPSPVVKDLGVWIDSSLNYDEHITKLSSSCLYKLCRINRIKHLLDRRTLITVINAFVFSRLFYCSTVWGNITEKNVKKLQRIQNFACRIILGLKKYDHVSDARESLGWLSVQNKLLLNTVTMVHKCRNNLAPPYLSALFQDRFAISGRVTRNSTLLNLPKCRLATGQRSFAFRGAKLYNALPQDLQSITDSRLFKRKAAAYYANIEI